MQISIVLGMLLVGALSVFSLDAKATAVISMPTGFMIGYFFAKAQADNLKK